MTEKRTLCTQCDEPIDYQVEFDDLSQRYVLAWFHLDPPETPVRWNDPIPPPKPPNPCREATPLDEVRELCEGILQQTYDEVGNTDQEVS